MSIQAGQTIRVEMGQHDDDTGIPIAGWSGRVIALHPETGMLEVDLRSPTQRAFDYQANQSLRSEMERAVNNAGVDLAMTTIEKGRPYTLRLTKTQAAYERKLKKWEEDRTLLEQLEQAGP